MIEKPLNLGIYILNLKILKWFMIAIWFDFKQKKEKISEQYRLKIQYLQNLKLMKLFSTLLQSILLQENNTIWKYKLFIELYKENLNIKQLFHSCCKNNQLTHLTFGTKLIGWIYQVQMQMREKMLLKKSCIHLISSILVKKMQ